MKVCSKCDTLKAESDFFIKDKKSGRLHAQCKLCYKEHRAGYYKKHYSIYREQYLERARKRRHILRSEFRNNMLDYLSGKACAICGEKDIVTFEFDHILPSEKKFSISRSVSLGYSWIEVKEELKKCRILCANCHKKETAKQFGWYKSS
ncbi:hypothetical protein HGB24_03450 [Candidatus Saccharibacteria bacterium]|nr:hypothetical protein [Candidatus Saccharibacteria bacterium]